MVDHSINPTASSSAKVSAVAGTGASGVNGSAASSSGQQYQFITTAVNNNIIRISGGALGFPVL